jgi:nicotinate phosphoribosyltransferase
MPGDRELRVPFLLAGERVGPPTLEESREHLRRAMVTLPWDGLKLSEGEAAIPTRFIPEH